MHRKRMTALAALQLLIALAVGSHSPSEARASDAASSGPASSVSSTPNTPNAQRRRRARRRRAADALLPGVWGGQHIRFEVTEGGANIEYDCAHGTVEGKILVDNAGRFNVAGTHYREHAGPVREGEGSNGQPVRFAGRVGGSLMSLTVTRGRETIGAYSLTRGSEGRIVKCR